MLCRFICITVLLILAGLVGAFSETLIRIEHSQNTNDGLQEPMRLERAKALNTTDALRLDAVRANLQRTEHSRSLLKIFDSRLLHGWLKDVHYMWALWRVGAEHAFYETHNQQLTSRIARLCALADASVTTQIAPALRAVCCGREPKYTKLCIGTSLSTCTPITLASVDKGFERNSNYSFGPAHAQRSAYTVHCRPAPPRLPYARDAKPRTRFMSCELQHRTAHACSGIGV